MSSEEDPLAIFDDTAICPDCSTIIPLGMARCPECGAFHVSIDEPEERPVDDREPVEYIEKESRDPGFYSINPTEEIPVEHFEGDDDAVTDWDGSSIDFALGEDE